MRRSRILSPLATAATLVALATLGGCGDSAPTVSRSNLEDQVSSELEQQVGTAPDDVTCPGDLTGEVGETMRCTLTAGADELGLEVKVTAVDGEDVSFDVQVDDQAQEGGES